MASAAAFITWIALAGALVSFVAGMAFSARRLTPGKPSQRWLVLVWPLAMRQFKGAESASDLNKALVAFMTCLMIAAAAWSAATNLHRFAR